MSAHLQRAQLLFSQSRFDMAEAELRRAIADQPQNARIRALLAECLQLRSKPAEALAEAQAAIQLAPDDSYAHYIHARILLKQDKTLPARKAIDEAIRLDPEQAGYFGLLSAIALEQHKPVEALEAAERGLAIDAEDSQCLNMRAMALVKLGRKKEAGATMQGALAKDPENAVTHANQGWTYLHRNDPKKALEHFREALRLEPGMEWARNGMIEALRARYFVYRWLLQYFLWTTRISPRARWAVVIGLYVVYQFARVTAQKQEKYAAVLWPLVGIYVGFVVLTWTGKPLFNVFLRLNRFGRMVLTEQERLASTVTAGLLLAAIALGGAWLIDQNPRTGACAIMVGLMLIPSAAALGCAPSRDRRLRLRWMWALAGLASLSMLAIQFDHVPSLDTMGLWVTVAFFLGIVAFQLLALRRSIHGRGGL